MEHKEPKYKPMICYWCGQPLAPGSRSRTAICQSCDALLSDREGLVGEHSQDDSTSGGINRESVSEELKS